MQFSLETSQYPNIEVVQPDHIVIAGVAYHDPLILSAQTLIQDWSGVDYDAPNPDCLLPFQGLSIELILLGTGKTHRLLPTVFYAFMSQQQIAIETMSTNAACRTYNVLSSENRKVAIGIQF